jgi:dTDP-4-amino-4,6-dideoxygalactose transaminase
MASATSGISLALKALVGDRPGVILGPHFAFNATVLAARWSGRPYVGLPVDRATFNLCPKAVREALQSRDVAAILAIGVAGNPAGLKGVEEAAVEAGAPFVVDAAPCLGSVGALGDATVISLSARKALPAGEGGLVLTRSAPLADRLRRLRQYGSLDGYYCVEAGLNARMSELHAAMALGCLPELGNTLGRRRAFAEASRGALCAVPGVAVQCVSPAEPPAWNDVLFRVRETARGTVVRRLRGLGLEAVTFSPLQRLPDKDRVPGRHQIPDAPLLSRQGSP